MTRSSSLREVRETLSRLPEQITRERMQLTVRTWENRDIAGYCLVDPILEEISNADFLLADITVLNFNVVYEIGYAMAKSKRVILLANKAIRINQDLMSELGIFDTFGYQKYQNSIDLCLYLQNLSSV